MIETTEIQPLKMPWEPAAPTNVNPTPALSASPNLTPCTEGHVFDITRHGLLEIAMDSSAFGVAFPPDALNAVRQGILEPQQAAVDRGVGSPISLASLRLQCGDIEGAKTILMGLSGPNYWAQHLLAMCHWRAGNTSEAERIFRGLADKDVGDSRPRHALGKLLAALKRYSDAVIVLQAAARIDDESPSVLNDLAAVLIATGDAKAALRTLRAALRLAPTYALALANSGVAHQILGHGAKASSFFHRALAADNTCVAAVHNLAETLLARSAWDAVTDLLRPYIDRVPEDARAHELLAWAYMCTNRLREAQRVFERGLKLRNERDPSLLNNLAMVYTMLGHMDRAHESFQRAIFLAPENSLLRANYAHLLANLKQWSLVRDVLRPVDVDSKPDRAAMLANALLATGAFEQAATLLNSVLQEFRELRFYQMLGNTLTSSLDRPDDAIEVYKEALKAFGDDHLLLNNLAYALIAAGKLVEARETLEPIVSQHRGKNDVTSVCVVASYGLLKIRLGQFHEGIAFYREALARGGSMKPRIKQKIHVEEGRFLVSSGEVAKAHKVLKLASTGPDAEFARQAEHLLRTISN